MTGSRLPAERAPSGDALGLRHRRDARAGAALRRGERLRLRRRRRPAAARRRSSCAASARSPFRRPTSDVWICPLPHGHLQATGARRARAQAVPLPPRVAARCRARQVRAPARVRRARCRAAPPRAARPRACRGLPRDKVLATLVRLLDTTYVRIGNDEYARSNGSYGLTTLRCRHAAVQRQRAAPALSRQERRARTASRSTTRGSRASCAAARRCRGRSCSTTSTTTASRAASARPTSTPTCARRPAATSPPRTSAPGTRRAACAGACAMQGRAAARDPRGGRAAARQHGHRVPQVVRASGRVRGRLRKGGVPQAVRAVGGGSAAHRIPRGPDVMRGANFETPDCIRATETDMLRTAVCLLACTVLVPVRADDASLARLGWLAGCWSSESGEPGSGEYWMAPAGGTMLGIGRTVKQGRTVEHEFLQIREVDGRIVYIATPSGQKTAQFAAARVGEREVVFENPSTTFRSGSSTGSTGRSCMRASRACATARCAGSTSDEARELRSGGRDEDHHEHTQALTPRRQGPHAGPGRPQRGIDRRRGRSRRRIRGPGIRPRRRRPAPAGDAASVTAWSRPSPCRCRSRSASPSFAVAERGPWPSASDAAASAASWPRKP